MKKEYKVMPGFVKTIDETAGVVEAIIAVFGNIDYKQDIIKKGAFKKTITENGTKVKVLDSHNSMSIMNVIGKPIEIAEITKSQLPDEITSLYPTATGGVYTKTQMLIDTPEGAGAFKRLKAGVIDEWSFGFQAIKFAYDKFDKDGNADDDGMIVRVIDELKLYEYGPVLWGANPATTTLTAKKDDPEMDDKELTERIDNLEDRVVELQEAVSDLKGAALPDNGDPDPNEDPAAEPELDPLTQDMFNLIEIERQKNKKLSLELERG